MTVRTFGCRAGVALAVLLAMLGTPRGGSAAEGDPLLDYGVAVVSNYVFRGIDLFVSVFDKEGEAHGAFLFSPAVQPSLTFYGPGGLAFGLWGSWALTDRDPEGAFAGLKTLDEIDYTLSWSWDNKLGSFSAGLVNYANVPSLFSLTEVFFTWGLPLLPGLSPKIAHYSVIDNESTIAANTYSSIAISGGEAVSWSLSAGMSKKLQDVTGSIGYAFGDVNVAFNAAYRPNPTLVGPYNDDGKYTAASGATEDYPPVVAWITLSYGGSVAE